jgi:hypothetical protein
VLEVYARLRGLPSSAFRGDAFEFDTRSSRADVIGMELETAVRAGHLVLRRPTRRAVVVTVEEDAEPVLGPELAAEPTAWLEIELVDDDGKPVPNIDYRIECDDGRVRTGTTNGSGKAREEGLQEGSCKVTFPGLHAPEWRKAG